MKVLLILFILIKILIFKKLFVFSIRLDLFLFLELLLSAIDFLLLVIIVFNNSYIFLFPKFSKISSNFLFSFESSKESFKLLFSKKSFSLIGLFMFSIF